MKLHNSTLTLKERYEVIGSVITRKKGNIVVVGIKVAIKQVSKMLIVETSPEYALNKNRWSIIRLFPVPWSSLVDCEFEVVIDWIIVLLFLLKWIVILIIRITDE